MLDQFSGTGTSRLGPTCARSWKWQNISPWRAGQPQDSPLALTCWQRGALLAYAMRSRALLVGNTVCTPPPPPIEQNQQLANGIPIPTVRLTGCDWSDGRNV